MKLGGRERNAAITGIRISGREVDLDNRGRVGKIARRKIGGCV